MKTTQTAMAVLAGLAALATAVVLRPQPTAFGAPQGSAKNTKTAQTKQGSKVTKIHKTEAQWKKILTPMQFNVLREEGTEAAFSGDYHPHKDKGVFRCAACNLDLFRSQTMFDSGTGWPSFYQPIEGRVENHADADGDRVEVECARCGGHLGHVFEDGPKPTGLRYCMNSVALKFDKQP